MAAHLISLAIRYLEKYQEKLKRRRKTAEELLLYKQELLKKEKELQEEEANISQIIDEAMKIDKPNSKSHHDLEATRTTPISKVEVVEHSEISVEQKPTTEYSTNTFESISLPLTSTPNQTTASQQQPTTEKCK